MKRNKFVEATQTLFGKNTFLGREQSDYMKVIDINNPSNSTELSYQQNKYL
jgi:hypothetical protein